MIRASVIQLSRCQRMSHLGRIHQQHFDFALCDPKTLAFVAVIELNDSSHQSQSRAKRDELIRRVCESAKLPLLEFPVPRSCVVNDVRGRIVSLSATDADAA